MSVVAQWGVALLFACLIMVVLPAIAVGVPFLFQNLSQYHYLRDAENGVEEAHTESFWMKVLHVYLNYLVSTMALIAALALSRFGSVGPSLNSYSALLIIFVAAVLMFSLRISAFIDLGIMGNNKQERARAARRKRNWLIGLGLSLLLSTFVLAMVAIGVQIIKPSPTSSEFSISGDAFIVIILTVGTFLLPLLMAIGSELLLQSFDIHPELKTKDHE